jgi:large subunit ribosomal protein L24
MKFKKGDNVIVIAGKDKGKKGKITRVFRAEERVIVEGVNMSKRHLRPKKSNEKGQIVSIETPLHASNVMFLDPKTNKPTRIGKKEVGGKMVRIAKKSNQEI